MPIAAVPWYLGKDFKDASPALRFGMYSPIWTDRRDQERDVNDRAAKKSREGDEVKELLRQGMEHAITVLRSRPVRPLPGLWDKNDFGARDAWRKVLALTKDDRQRMDGLLEREKALAATVPSTQLLRLDAQAIAPFTTGLGNEHPLENGFAFLNPYGLPYLPGSGVKGVLRQAARELASGAWGEKRGWSDDDDKPYRIEIGNETVSLSMLDVFFGRESISGDQHHVRGALTFWDVIPQIAPEDPKKPDQISLAVEIMTPHQSHYYQQKPAVGSTNPHDSGQPNPICFLTVPPGSRFVFHVVCDLVHLKRLAPDLVESDHWKTLLQSAFDHAFAWLGFGAKTAVGYGTMKPADESSTQAGGRQASSKPHSRRVDDALTELSSKPGITSEQALRSKTLAEAVRAIENEKDRQEALADIVNRWKEKGWWDRPSGSAAKQAKAIYDELLKNIPS